MNLKLLALIIYFIYMKICTLLNEQKMRIARVLATTN